MAFACFGARKKPIKTMKLKVRNSLTLLGRNKSRSCNGILDFRPDQILDLFFAFPAIELAPIVVLHVFRGARTLSDGRFYSCTVNPVADTNDHVKTIVANATDCQLQLCR